MVYIFEKKKMKNLLILILSCKKCDFKFIIKMLTIKKIEKVLEFNILQLNNINYVSILPSNEAREKKMSY